MAIEAEVQQNEDVVHKDAEDVNSENAELAHTSIQIPNETAKKEVQRLSEGQIEEFYFSDKMKRAGRLSIFLVCIIFLLAGRFSVPDNEVFCVQDKLIDALNFANSFINAPGNEIYRNFFQFFCSLLIDITFIVTFGYWVLRGTSGRLPVTLGIFYITRALIQMVWFSPFPQGFYWDSPGIPSLVVPYGRGSDFFFSGHSGFLIICASEWHKLKMPKVRNFVLGTAIYTILILLAYRIHYTIDIFTGVIFAEWCFTKVDANRMTLDNYWIYYVSKIKNMIIKRFNLKNEKGALELPKVKIEACL